MPANLFILGFCFPRRKIFHSPNNQGLATEAAGIIGVCMNTGLADNALYYAEGFNN